MGEWRYSFTILDLDTRWRRVVRLTSLPLYPQDGALPIPIGPPYLLDRRLSCLQSKSGRYGEEKISYLAKNRSPVVQFVA
jgi:hypothetical protein